MTVNLSPLKPRDRLNAVESALRAPELVVIDGVPHTRVLHRPALYVVPNVTITYAPLDSGFPVTVTGEVVGVSANVVGGAALVMRGPAGTLSHFPLSLLRTIEVPA